MSRCTIVVPCYNEAGRLDCEAFRRFDHPRVDFLFVNDGSTDGTLALLRELHRQAPARRSVYDLPANCGKAEAVRRGVLRAAESRAEYVGFWDADLATPLDAIPRFLDVLDTRPNVAVVLGARVQLLGRTIQRRAVRHYLGRLFATAASLVLRMAVYDTQCGAKLFRARPDVLGLFDRPFKSRWIFDVEILARWSQSALARGLRPEDAIYELPLDAWREVAGSKLRAIDFVKAISELATIWRTYRPSPRTDERPDRIPRVCEPLPLDPETVKQQATEEPRDPSQQRPARRDAA